MLHRRLLSLLCSIALSAGVLAAVASPAGAAQARTVQVPALWAGTDAKGKPVSGIERATVTTRETPVPEFEVDLKSVKAKGAGPQWVAASALAAAVGMLYAGNDPRVYGANYTITGPIDGPSAGAILTIGTLAALRGDRLDDKVTMTGTISPDGTVGVVGLVLYKIRAAARAGFDTVLIPYGTQRQFDGTKEVDAVEFGKSLGLDVRVVEDVTEAYRVFTGKNLVPKSAAIPALEPAVEAVVASTTAALAARTASALAALPAGVSAAERDDLAAQVAAVQTAAAGTDRATAYGLGVDTYQNLQRAAARADLRAAVAANGVDAARTALIAQIDAVTARADAFMAAKSQVAGRGLEVQLQMPIALGWITYATATLGYFRIALTDPATNADELELVATAIADQQAGVDVFGPDAVATVEATAATRGPRDAQVASFLSGYSTFLRTAADADLEYATATAGDAAKRANPEAFGTATGMQAGNSVISKKTDPLDQEVVQLARAVSYFAFGEVLVSGRSFGLRGFGLGADPTLAGDSTLLANSVGTGADLSIRSASQADTLGSPADYGIWQSQWGKALFDRLAGTPREGAAGAIALGEIWYSVIGSRLVIAAEEGLVGK